MTDCTVTGNSGTDGGGVANYGTLTMIGSTVSHNSTELNSVGGGLFNQGTMTLINSTVANNFALYGGGGLYNSGSGTLTLDDCTIAGNTAEAGPGAGIDNDGTGTVTLDNTIVADSHGSPGGDIAGKVSGSNNLIDDAATSGGLTNGVNGNLVGVDPKLGALGKQRRVDPDHGAARRQPGDRQGRHSAGSPVRHDRPARRAAHQWQQPSDIGAVRERCDDHRRHDARR